MYTLFLLSFSFSNHRIPSQPSQHGCCRRPSVCVTLVTTKMDVANGLMSLFVCLFLRQGISIKHDELMSIIANTACHLLQSPQSVVTLPQLGGLCASKTPEALPAGVLLLVGFTMLDRLWGRGQTKCNTDATDAGNISAWTELVDDPVMRCPSQSPDWTSHGPTTRNAWVCVLCHLSCGYPLPCDAESLACHADG